MRFIHVDYSSGEEAGARPWARLRRHASRAHRARAATRKMHTIHKWVRHPAGSKMRAKVRRSHHCSQYMRLTRTCPLASESTPPRLPHTNRARHRTHNTGHKFPPPPRACFSYSITSHCRALELQWLVHTRGNSSPPGDRTISGGATHTCQDRRRPCQAACRDYRRL